MVKPTLIPIKHLWVNYAYMGMDEGWPRDELPGTLITTMSHGQVIKIDQEFCRQASPTEIRSWSGPTSPSWVRR